MRRAYKIVAIVMALAAAAGVYRYRWGVLGVVGIGPPQSACESVEALETYLNTGGDPSAYLGRTPLIMCAVEAGSEEVVAKLLEVDADVNGQKTGPLLPVMSPGLDDTALHAAVRQNELEIIRMLVQNDADINLQNSFEESPLDIAIATGQNSVLDVFLAEETLTYEIHAGAIAAAVENRHLGAIEQLLSQGIEIEESSGLALCVAARENDAKAAKFLIENGAQVNSKLTQNFTPLHCASQRGSLNVAKVLVSEGANINAVGRDDQVTPLHLSTMTRELDLSGFLIENGANVNAVDDKGNTPLHIASRQGQLDLVELLVESGADVYSINDIGNTPLNEASSEGNVEVEKYLEEIVKQ